ncbi:MAG: hypothetical protein ABI873_10585 [Marmoricola sp.]
MRSARRIGTVLVALSLAATAACGATTGTPTAPKLKAMSAAKLHSALLTRANLGTDYYIVGSSSKSPNLGCLSIDVSAALSPTRKAERGFARKVSGGSGLPLLVSVTGSYVDQNKLLDDFDAYASSFADCPSVDATKDGVRSRLTVTVDRDKRDGAVDDQVNVNVVGTVTTRGIRSPFGLRLTGVRLGNDVMFVGYLDLAHDTSGPFDRVVAASYDRFRAVVHGEKPPAARKLLEHPKVS